MWVSLVSGHLFSLSSSTNLTRSLPPSSRTSHYSRRCFLTSTNPSICRTLCFLLLSRGHHGNVKLDTGAHSRPRVGTTPAAPQQGGRALQAWISSAPAAAAQTSMGSSARRAPNLAPDPNGSGETDDLSTTSPATLFLSP